MIDDDMMTYIYEDHELQKIYGKGKLHVSNYK